MDDVTAPTLGLAAAAHAAGLDLPYLRAMLAEGRMVLFGQPVRQPGQHHRASVVDLVRLRVLLRLRDAGLNDAQAVYVVDLALDPLLGGIMGCGLPVPRSFLAERLDGGAFHVIPDDGDDMPDVYTRPAGTPAPCDADVAITINLASILADTFARLDAHTSTAAVLLGRSRGLGGSRGGVPAISTTTAADAANPGSNA